MHKYISVLILAIFLLVCNQEKQEIQIPLETKNYKNLSLNSEILDFLAACEINSDLIDFDTLGFSEKGKVIPLVKITNDKQKKKKTNVLFFGQQHGNEPAGKEGLLLLIKDFANNKHINLLDSINLYILPQCNPDGGDLYQRRNANDFDLNRDHVLLNTQEVQLIQKLFSELKPEFTCDFHEYYAYSNGWKEFGYRRDFDIQLGGLTNINVDKNIRNWFYDKVFPEVEMKLETNAYKFFEYTLGYFPENERLRHSTVDVNDGRQSFGIGQSMSFIVEGKRDLDSIYLIERRAESQKLTALSLLENAYINNTEILNIVHAARKKDLEINKKIAIRLDHFPGSKPLHYTLWDIENEKDTTFLVENYHPLVKSTLDIEKPKGYLIPKSDSLLTAWLKRSFYEYSDAKESFGKAIAYEIKNIETVTAESWESKLATVVKKDVSNSIEWGNYYYISTNQFLNIKLVTSLEPQALYGLASYSDFEYLLEQDLFPILRVE